MGIGMALTAHLDQHPGRDDRVAGRRAQRRQGRTADLASELQLEADELLPIAETLQLMRFAEIDGRTIRLTAGRPALRRGRRRRAQAAVRPAPVGLCAAGRPHPPGARRPRLAPGARPPLPRRAGGLHVRGLRRGDAGRGGLLGPLRRGLRLPRGRPTSSAWKTRPRSHRVNRGWRLRRPWTRAPPASGPRRTRRPPPSPPRSAASTTAPRPGPAARPRSPATAG